MSSADEILTIECDCGMVFEPENIEIDNVGEKWAKCPKCKKKILLPAGY